MVKQGANGKTRGFELKESKLKLDVKKNFLTEEILFFYVNIKFFEARMDEALNNLV